MCVTLSYVNLVLFLPILQVINYISVEYRKRRT